MNDFNFSRSLTKRLLSLIAIPLLILVVRGNLIAQSTSNQQSENNTNKGLNTTSSRVTIKSVSKYPFIISNKDSFLYLITVDYEFSKSKAVSISNFGLAKSKGEFKYLTDNPAVVIKDAFKDSILYSSPISFTELNMSPDPDRPRAPAIEDYLFIARTGVYNDPLKFDEKMRNVLNKNFKRGWYNKSESGINYTLTAYQQIQVKSKPFTVAEVSVLFSFPFKDNNNNSIYKLSFLVRESRKFDSTLVDPSPETNAAVDSFIEDIFKALK